MIETIPLIGISVWTVAKLFLLFAMGLYVIFALVVARQVKLMTDTLAVGFETMVKTLAKVHLIFSVIVFVLALIIL